MALATRTPIKESVHIIRHVYKDGPARDAMDTHWKETVLVIDEPVVVDGLRAILSEEGFEVGSASGGTEGGH